MDGSVETNTEVSVHEVMPNGLNSYEVDFKLEYNGFLTEWFKEDGLYERLDTFAITVSRLIGDSPIRVQVEVDRTGNGEPDIISKDKEVPKENFPIVFDTIPVDPDYQYRIILRDLRFDDDIDNVQPAITH